MGRPDKDNLSVIISDPKLEIEAAREGIHADQIESFLKSQGMQITEVLKRLNISASTFFKMKQNKEILNTAMTAKFLRLVRILSIGERVLRTDADVQKWLDREAASLGNQRPFDLLDTEPGGRLVEQALLQIEHGIYS